jgi:predicted RNase H-like HicB family nuclease
MSFTAVYKKDGDWWVGFVAEIPGANTQGATLEEARENLKEAVRMVLEANRELAREDLEDPTAIREEIEVA